MQFNRASGGIVNLISVNDTFFGALAREGVCCFTTMDQNTSRQIVHGGSTTCVKSTFFVSLWPLKCVILLIGHLLFKKHNVLKCYLVTCCYHCTVLVYLYATPR